ncbi:unnamed protein product [Somion occarium]|uniref:Uncharacterized protein n=1 Tax=Somion occarium TaxID=3059160 RepID=A0ABP1DUH7_9APHY
MSTRIRYQTGSSPGHFLFVLFSIELGAGSLSHFSLLLASFTTYFLTTSFITMFTKSISAVFAAILLSGAVLPALSMSEGYDEMNVMKRSAITGPNRFKPPTLNEIAWFNHEDDPSFTKRIVIPECSGDPNTPKPDFCSQFGKPPPTLPNGLRIAAFKRDLERRIVIPECSGDPSTPKPAYCSQFGKPAPTLPNGLRIAAFKRELERRIVNLRCSGDPATLPADCFNRPAKPPTTFNGYPFLELRSRNTELAVAKRIFNAHCSGDPATIPADCVNKPPRPSSRLFPDGLPGLEAREEGLSGLDLAKRIINTHCSIATSVLPPECYNLSPFFTTSGRLPKPFAA